MKLEHQDGERVSNKRNKSNYNTFKKKPLLFSCNFIYKACISVDDIKCSLYKLVQAKNYFPKV